MYAGNTNKHSVFHACLHTAHKSQQNYSLQIFKTLITNIFNANFDDQQKITWRMIQWRDLIKWKIGYNLFVNRMGENYELVIAIEFWRGCK